MVVKVTDKLNRTQQYYGLSNEMKSMVGTAFQIKHSIGAGVKLIGPSGKMFTFHHSSVEALPNPEEVRSIYKATGRVWAR